MFLSFVNCSWLSDPAFRITSFKTRYSYSISNSHVLVNLKYIYFLHNFYVAFPFKDEFYYVCGEFLRMSPDL